MFVNAIVSTLVLENTFINVNGSYDRDMFILSLIMPFFFWFDIVLNNIFFS